MWKSVLKWLVGPFIALVISRGILGALHRFELYPDLWVEGLIVSTPGAFQDEFTWAVTAVLAALLITAWYFFSLGERIKSLGQRAIPLGSKNMPKDAGGPPGQTGTPFPDMTIEELFYYICDDTDFMDAGSKVLEDNNWIKIGGEIRDQASLGRLTFWGRAKSGENPPTEILKEYWKEGKFTYKFFGERDDDPPHTRTGPEGDKLWDLRVNQSRVRVIWPPSGGGAPIHKISKKDIAELIGNAAQLREIVTSYRPIERIRGQFNALYKNIESSTSEVWADTITNQARRDFLQSCALAFHGIEDRNNAWAPDRNRQNREEVVEAWKILNRRLAQVRFE